MKVQKGCERGKHYFNNKFRDSTSTDADGGMLMAGWAIADGGNRGMLMLGRAGWRISERAGERTHRPASMARQLYARGERGRGRGGIGSIVSGADGADETSLICLLRLCPRQLLLLAHVLKTL